eukprot:TRINITY_DN53581_c0_g3_i3.p1 TRINITY_DN53581_c0_g3~~TRINITY_DN53581_c0_g3_i3.p1  ORF type:complete len:112 (+),score=34.33 TRINITY_DN53581_c0_g3_i3:169-504(+)
MRIMCTLPNSSLSTIRDLCISSSLSKLVKLCTASAKLFGREEISVFDVLIAIWIVEEDFTAMFGDGSSSLQFSHHNLDDVLYIDKFYSGRSEEERFQCFYKHVLNTVNSVV